MVWDLISLSNSMTWIVLGPQQYDILKTQRNTDTSDCTGLWRLWRVLRSHQLVQFSDIGCFGNITTRCRTMGAIAPSSHKRTSYNMDVKNIPRNYLPKIHSTCPLSCSTAWSKLNPKLKCSLALLFSQRFPRECYKCHPKWGWQWGAY